MKSLLESINSEFNVETVQSEKIRGIPDKRLLGVLLREERILITSDRDFENLLMYPPGSHFGIIILRSKKQGKSTLGALITEFFKDFTNQGYQNEFLLNKRIAVKRIDFSKVIMENLE